MGYILQRLTGRKGLAEVQTSSQAASTDFDGPVATSVTIEGTSYPAYSVWNLTEEMLDPNYTPTVEVSGSGLPPAYDYKIDWIAGRVIFTPALLATAVPTISGLYAAVLTPVGDTIDFDISTEGDTENPDQMAERWQYPQLGHVSWRGSLTAYWRNTPGGTGSVWWLASAAKAFGPRAIKLWPSRGSDECYMGHALLSWGHTVRTGEGMRQQIDMTGVGPLSLKKGNEIIQ